MDAGAQRCSDTVRGVVTGPRAGYEALVRAEMARLDYAVSSVRSTIEAMSRLSDWLVVRGVVVPAVTPYVIAAFRAAQRPRVYSGLGAALRVLREHGVIPTTVISSDLVELLIVDYRRWLRVERGLAAETVRCYGNQARTFLRRLPAPLCQSLADLDGAAVGARVSRTG